MHSRVRQRTLQTDGKTIPGVAELLANDFSTTTPTERVAAQVSQSVWLHGIWRPMAGSLVHPRTESCRNVHVLTSHFRLVASQVTAMEMLQEFFDYKMMTSCGYPTITLESAPEDWHRLRAKVEALVSQKCTNEFADRWTPAVISVLDRVVAQVDNHARWTSCSGSRCANAVALEARVRAPGSTDGRFPFIPPSFDCPSGSCSQLTSLAMIALCWGQCPRPFLRRLSSRWLSLI